MSRVRLFAFGLVAASVVTAGAVAAMMTQEAGRHVRGAAQPVVGAQPAVASAGGQVLPVPVADTQEPAGQDGSNVVHAEAPGTRVNVDKQRGNVSITAPYTDVRVDPDKGQVQVRAPHVNLDIRW